MTSTQIAMTSSPSALDHREQSSAAPRGRSNTFLVLAVLGLLGQLALFGVFLADKGLDPGEFADQIFASTIAALAFADLMACVVVFLAWMPREAARAGIGRWWPFALATLGGLCFAFPLFLHYREKRRAAGIASAVG
jgi:Terpene cyclase DEP1